MQDASIGVSIITAMLVCAAATDKLSWHYGLAGAVGFLVWNYIAQPRLDKRASK